jgi:hypothetical protein
MNDLERQVRETFLRHQVDAPSLDTAEARRAAGRGRRRQARNVVIGAIVGTAVVIVAFAGTSGPLRADRPPTVLDSPPSSLPTSVATPPILDGPVLGWPGPTKNRAGVYSWDASPFPQFPDQTVGWMHNGYESGSGDVNVTFDGDPGRLVPHRGNTAVTVAGYEGTYRRFTMDASAGYLGGLPAEEWMVDIEGTTVTIRIVAEPRARDTELAEARGIIQSIRVEPRDNALGFRLVFTLQTGAWDSG